MVILREDITTRFIEKDIEKVRTLQKCNSMSSS